MQRGQPEYQWASLAEQFPASLVTDIAPEKLKDGQTPDAYGMGIEQQSVLYKSAYTDVGSRSSTWSSVSTPTTAPSGITNWRYYFDRLWGYMTTGQSLYYGAFGNYTYYMQQDASRLLLDSEATNITGVQPFGSNLAIFKAGNLYVMRNANNPGAGFMADLVAEQGTDAELKTIGLNESIYFANANGIWSSDGRTLRELTMPIRNNLGDVKAASITRLNADFDKSRIIGYEIDGETNDVKFVLIPGMEGGAGIFTYSGTDFRFTSRSVLSGKGNPIMVDKIALNYEYDSDDQIDISFQVKINDTWQAEERTRVMPKDKAGRIELVTNHVLAARRWAFRLTSIPASFYIHSIETNIKSGSESGYAVK